MFAEPLSQQNIYYPISNVAFFQQKNWNGTGKKSRRAYRIENIQIELPWLDVECYSMKILPVNVDMHLDSCNYVYTMFVETNFCFWGWI